MAEVEGDMFMEEAEEPEGLARAATSFGADHLDTRRAFDAGVGAPPPVHPRARSLVAP
jgi:hypothetical protein